jgi:hypothetical protein
MQNVNNRKNNTDVLKNKNEESVVVIKPKNIEYQKFGVTYSRT